MDSNLIITSTKGMSYETWLQFRKKGIGASESGAVMGLSEYTSPIALFYDKSSPLIKKKPDNFAMFMGRYSEDYISDLWQYWDGDTETLMENFSKGRVIRKCQRVNAYIQNPKWKWLFVSLDRKINKNYFHGKEYGEGNLELKNMSGWEVQKWESGIPSNYLIQVMTQMGVCGFDYGELCIFKDGRNFDVHHFEFNKEIFESIVEMTHEFWIKVEEAKVIVTQIYEADRTFNMALKEELEAKLVEIEPPIDGSDAVSDFLSEKYKRGTSGERIGTPDEKTLAIKHKQTKENIKELAEKVKLYENELKSSMRTIECLNFGSDGKVFWSNTSKGGRRFVNNLKL